MFQGWRQLGIPEKITKDGVEMDLGASIRDVLEDRSEVTVIPSIKIAKYDREGSKKEH